MYYSKKVTDSLDLILNKAFCYLTFWRAIREYNKIKDDLVLEDRMALKWRLLMLDPDYPDGPRDSGEERGMKGDEIARLIKVIKCRQSADAYVPPYILYYPEHSKHWIEANNYGYPEGGRISNTYRMLTERS